MLKVCRIPIFGGNFWLVSNTDIKVTFLKFPKFWLYFFQIFWMLPKEDHKFIYAIIVFLFYSIHVICGLTVGEYKRIVCFLIVWNGASLYRHQGVIMKQIPTVFYIDLHSNSACIFTCLSHRSLSRHTPLFVEYE